MKELIVTIKGVVKEISPTSYTSAKTGKVYENNLIEFENGKDYRGHSKSFYLKIEKTFPVVPDKDGVVTISGTDFVARGVADHAEYEMKPIAPTK